MDFIKPIASNILGNVGGQVIGNALVTQPNANTAFGQSQYATAQAYERSKEAASAAWDRSYGAYKTRYQDTMNDMRLAGLNPILAASGGFNVGSSPNAPAASVSTAQAFKADQPTYNYSQSALDLSQKDKTEMETKKTEVEVRKVYADVLQTIANTIYTTAQSKLAGQNLQNAIQQHAKIVQDIKLGKLSLEQRNMRMKVLRRLEKEMGASVKILNYLESGKIGVKVQNYVEGTKNMLNNAWEKTKNFLGGN